MAERGDSGRTPRHTLFYFYGGKLDGLRNAAVGTGYKVSPTVHHDGLVLEITTAVDEPSFESHTRQMEMWAEEFGCEYDGWECQLVVQ